MTRSWFRTVVSVVALTSSALITLGCPPEKKKPDEDGHVHEKGDGHDHSKEEK